VESTERALWISVVWRSAGRVALGPMSGNGPLDISEENDFHQHGVAIFGDARRLDDVCDALRWVIARCPDYYPLVPGTSLRVAPVGVMGSEPRAWVFYHHESPSLCRLIDIVEI
jgi:hypothetical protein